jgi:hypothetical protein
MPEGSFAYPDKLGPYEILAPIGKGGMADPSSQSWDRQNVFDV